MGRVRFDPVAYLLYTRYTWKEQFFPSPGNTPTIKVGREGGESGPKNVSQHNHDRRDQESLSIIGNTACRMLVSDLMAR